MTLFVQKMFTVLSAISFSLSRAVTEGMKSKVLEVLDTSNCPLTLPRNNYLMSFRDMCLRFVLTERSWTDARDDCKKNEDGLLVQILDAETQLFIVNTLKSLNWNHHGVWIGAYDLEEEGNWIWVTGQRLSYSNWRSGYGPERTGFFSTRFIDDCAQIRLDYGGQWQDKPCYGVGVHYSYICQYHKISTPAPITTSGKTTKTLGRENTNTYHHQELTSSAESTQLTSTAIYQTNGPTVATATEWTPTRTENSAQGQVTVQPTSTTTNEINGTTTETKGITVLITTQKTATHKENSAQGQVTVQPTSTTIHTTNGTTVPTTKGRKATNKNNLTQGQVTVEPISAVIHESNGTTVLSTKDRTATHNNSAHGQMTIRPTVEAQFEKYGNTYSGSSATVKQKLSSNPVTPEQNDKIKSSTLYDHLKTNQSTIYPKTVEGIKTKFSSLKTSRSTFLKLLHSNKITNNIHVNSKETSKMLPLNEITSTVRQDTPEVEGALNQTNDYSSTTLTGTAKSITISYYSKPKDLSLNKAATYTMQVAKETTLKTSPSKTPVLHQTLGSFVGSGNDISSMSDDFLHYTTRNTFHNKQHLKNRKSNSTTITLCGTIIGGVLILTIIGAIIFICKNYRQSKRLTKKEDNIITFDNSTYDSLNTDSFQRRGEHDV